MKTRLLKPSDLREYTHPAIILFRSLELKCVYENTKDITFEQPSMDLGSGDGYLASLLFDKRFTYGIDNGEAHDYQISIEKKRYEKVLLESAEHMSLPDSSLQFVFCNSVIEHIPDNEAVLSEVSRTLAKNGVFIFTSPSHRFQEYLCISNQLLNHPLSVLTRPLAEWYKAKRQAMLNHYHTLSHEEWTRRLKKHNLQVVNYDYYISKETCILWDRIALEVKIRGLFDKEAEQKALKKYQQQIEHIYKSDNVAGTEGASLFIHAVKK